MMRLGTRYCADPTNQELQVAGLELASGRGGGMRASCQLLGLKARYCFLACASRACASASARGLGLPKAMQ